MAFDHALASLKWPNGCSMETSFLWSSVMLEQAEVLVRAGMSANKLSTIISEKTATTEQEKAEQVAEVVGLMEQSLETLAFQWIDSADAYPHAALGVAALAWHLPDHARRQPLAHFGALRSSAEVSRCGPGAGAAWPRPGRLSR